MVGSADTSTNGLALTIAVTSAIRVVNTSCERCLGSQVGQHGVKYSSRDAYHSLPGSPSVGCVRNLDDIIDGESEIVKAISNIPSNKEVKKYRMAEAQFECAEEIKMLKKEEDKKNGFNSILINFTLYILSHCVSILLCYNVAIILPFVYSIVYLFRKMVYNYLFGKMV